AEGVAVGGNNKILAIGNPLVASGRFYQAFKGATGWTKRTISGLHHPNVTGKGKRIPGCVTRDFVDEKVEDWCEEESVGRRVKGVGETEDGFESDRLPIDPMTQLPNDPETLHPKPYTLHPPPDVFVWKGRRYKPGDLFRI